MTKQENHNYRLLKIHYKRWLESISKQLITSNITQNQISLIGVFSAFAAGLCFYGFSLTEKVFFLLLAPALIQLRLLCNSFGALVTIEGGKTTKSSKLFSNIFDRCAYVFIFVGAGNVIGIDFGFNLGWVTAVLALFNAYIHTLGSSLGVPISFAVPVVKENCMDILTGASLLAMIESLVWQTHYILLLALWVIVLGGLLTFWRRTRALYLFVENKVD